MKTEDGNEALHPWIEPELEARLTALVLGEASDFERDELERLVAGRPELGLYYKRLEAMHRMLREVASGESTEEQGEWKLGAERRERLLEHLSGSTRIHEPKSATVTRRSPWSISPRFLAVAATIAIIGLMLGLMFPASTGALRSKGAKSQWDGDVYAYESSGYDRERMVRESDVVWESPGPAEASVKIEGESKAVALADRAVRLPAPTSATPAPPAEPMGVDKPGQIGALNGAAAIGSGGVALGIDPSSPTRVSVNTSGNSSTNVRVGGGFEGRDSGSSPVAGEPMTSTLGGLSTYTGGTAIASVDAFGVTSPESASPTAPVVASTSFAVSAVEVPQVAKDVSKVQGMTSAPSMTMSGVEIKGTGETGGRSVPQQVGAAPFSGPAATDPEITLTKLGAGTLALNGENVDLVLSEEMVEADGFVDHKQKTDAPVSAPAAGGIHQFTGDLQVNGGFEARVNAATNSLSLGSGGMIAGVGGTEKREGFGNESPAKLDALSRAEGSGVAAGQEGDVSRMGRSVAVEKSMEESIAQGIDLAGTDRTRDHVIRRELPATVAETISPVGTINFGAATSTIENLSGFFEVTETSGTLDTKTAERLKNMRYFEDGGAEFNRTAREDVDKSVQDILALTPQIGKDGHLFTQHFLGGATGLRGFDYRDVPAKDSGEETAVRLDYAAPLDESKWTNEGRFQFTMGASFGDEKTSTAGKPVTNLSLRQLTPAALAETTPSAEPFSTFSLHVSDVSFQLAKSSLASGKWPEAEKIRIEEFVNAFDYGDPVPSIGERVACRIDQGAHPFLQQRNLVRIALRTAEAGRSSGTPLRLTLLLDSSGSMERPDRRATLTRAVATLASLLGENDRITLVSFARQPRLVADAVAGNEAMKLAETVASLPSEGGTNLEAALELAFEKAREHQEVNAQNRIVLLTDGAANLGDAKAESLGQRVEMMREAGIAFDAAGFGAEGLNDEILEALTRKGDGRYYLLDRPEDAGAAFADQIAGALRPAAKNVKVQVEFNPDRVKSYKLLGFEKHRLATEDFRNDAVDAAELAAAEAGVAVYQVEPDPAGEGDLGSVSVRFRDLESGGMIERRWSLPHLAAAPAPEQGGEAILLATVASQFAAKLAGGPVGDVVDLGELARLAADLPESERVNELRTMIEQARGLEGDR